MNEAEATPTSLARPSAPQFTEKTFYLEEFYGKSLLFALVPPVGQRMSDFGSLVKTLRELRRFAHERKWNATALVIDVDPLTLL